VEPPPGYLVVGCDSRPGCGAALRFAFSEARVRATHVVIVAAYHRPVDPDLDEFDTTDQQFREQTESQVEQLLTRTLGPGRSDLPDYRIVAAEGDPARILVTEAADAAMIVIGIHDRPLLGRLFRHLTREHILHACRVPVTIVPPGAP
jgi:nucleotide-binding universal stress UspA family protein